MSYFNGSFHVQAAADLSSDSEGGIKADSFTFHEERLLQVFPQFLISFLYLFPRLSLIEYFRFKRRLETVQNLQLLM
jgi:hypothetical protein